MRKQNGTTIIEILLSVIIISIVMALLFNMLIQVRNEDVTNQIQSTFVLNQATMIKEVEEDIITYGIKEVSTCTLSEANISASTLNPVYTNNYKCIKITYAAEFNQDNIGFLLLYNLQENYRDGSTKWVVQYMRGRYTKYSESLVVQYPVLTSWKSSIRMTKDYPQEIILNDPAYVSYTAASGTNAQNAGVIVFPIQNGDGEHYDINISFTFTNNNNFKCLTNIEPNHIECRCLSGEGLCRNTLS